MLEAPKRPLNKEVSIQELMYYREQGLRNSEIAKLLETTSVTIRKYIGGDGKRGRPPKNRGNKFVDNNASSMV